MKRQSHHEKSIHAQRKLMLGQARRALDRLDELSAAVRRCIEGEKGTFPYYMGDLTDVAVRLQLLDAAYHVLGNAHFDAALAARRSKKRTKKVKR